jgi:hypothetical protein
MSYRQPATNENTNMKKIITLSAIIVLAAFAFVGCNQSSSTDTTPPGSGVSTNLPATNSLPNVSTNMAGTNQ